MDKQLLIKKKNMFYPFSKNWYIELNNIFHSKFQKNNKNTQTSNAYIIRKKMKKTER